MEVQTNLYYFLLDDIPSYQHEIVINQRPSIPSPEADYYSVGDITGVDGSDYESLGTYRNIEIEMNCSFVSDDWNQTWRDIKAWVLGSTHKTLRVSEDETIFRKIAKITLGSISRDADEVGNFTITFECYPYEYLNSGNFEFDYSVIKKNEYFTCHPTYRIKGNGLCSINVNGNLVQVQCDDEVYIDTDLKLAYSGSSLVRLKSGNYEDMYLVNGDVSITVSDGFELKVRPNWRCL